MIEGPSMGVSGSWAKLAVVTWRGLRGCAAFVGLLWVACMSVVACVPAAKQTTITEASAEPIAIEAYPRRANMHTIAVFLPQTKDTVTLWQSMRDELNESYEVVPFIMHDDTTVEQMTRFIRETKPLCAILVNNPTVRLYQEMQRREGSQNLPPGFVVMASYLPEIAAGMENIAGIAYEVPAVTSFVNVRSFITKRITRVGVVRRQAFASYIAKQRELALQEKFQIVDVVVSDDLDAAQLRAALQALRDKGSVEAIWVLNDNALLRHDLIVEGWLEALKTDPLPVIVGVGALVSKDFHFGSFAILPDHSALGVQTAEAIFELADVGWNTSEIGIAQPLSVESVVDINYAREHFGFREENLLSVDHVVQ